MGWKSAAPAGSIDAEMNAEDLGVEVV